MNIRVETPADKSRVATLIARTYLERGAEMISKAGQLRRLETADADLRFVAEIGNVVASFLMLSPLASQQSTARVAYLSVFAIDSRLDDFNGAEFLQKVSEKAQEKGYTHIILQSDLGDFGQFGFLPMDSSGVSLTVPEGADSADSADGAAAADSSEHAQTNTSDVLSLPFIVKPLAGDMPCTAALPQVLCV